MIKLFYTDDRPLHQALEAAFAKALTLVHDEDALLREVQKGEGGLVILDADYGFVSGYAICEKVKAQKGDWRVHILSNEAGVGEEEKASYAGVDRLFIVPLKLNEIAQI